MYRKIISLLCALALLASAVAGTTASAAGTSVDLLASKNMGKWYIQRGSTKRGYYAGVVDMTGYQGWTSKYNAADDIQGMLVVKAFASDSDPNARWLTFTYDDKLTFDAECSVSMTPYIRCRNYGRPLMDRDDAVGLTLGRYAFFMTRVKDQEGEDGNYNRFCLVVYKDGQELGRTGVTADLDGAAFAGKRLVDRYPDLAMTTSMWVPKGTEYADSTLDDRFSDTDQRYVAAHAYWSDLCTGTKNADLGGMFALMCSYLDDGETIHRDNAGARDYTISLKGGKLSVLDVRGNAVAFTTASGSVTSFDATAAELSGVPVVKIQGSNLSMADCPMAMLRLRATGATATAVPRPQTASEESGASSAAASESAETVSGEDRSAATGSEQIASSAQAEPTDDAGDAAPFPWLWVGIGAGVLLLAGAAVAVILILKKKKA